MSPGGIIFFSTNFRRFKLAEEELRGVTIREISRQTVPPDFRNRRIHRCWRMVKGNEPEECGRSGATAGLSSFAVHCGGPALLDKPAVASGKRLDASNQARLRAFPQ